MTAAEPQPDVSRSLSGVGVHTGAPVSMVVHAAPAGHGISFRTEHGTVPADIDYVTSTARRTVMGNGAAHVETVEHFLAAAHAQGLPDLVVEVDGPELPIGDGSALHFQDVLRGMRPMASDRTPASGPDAFEVVTTSGSTYAYEPAADLVLDVSIEWNHPLIGRQSFVLHGPGSFSAELAGARTFVMEEDVARLRDEGLLKGGDLGSGLVLTKAGLRNGPLRWPDEFARHKTLDLLGDLTLVGAPIRGVIRAWRPSHAGNIQFVRELRTRISENRT